MSFFIVERHPRDLILAKCGERTTSVLCTWFALLDLANQAEDKGRVNCSQGEIAHLAGVTVRTVRSALASLEDLKLVSSEPGKNQVGGQGRNDYILHSQAHKSPRSQSQVTSAEEAMPRKLFPGLSIGNNTNREEETNAKPPPASMTQAQRISLEKQVEAWRSEIPALEDELKYVTADELPGYQRKLKEARELLTASKRALGVQVG